MSVYEERIYIMLILFEDKFKLVYEIVNYLNMVKWKLIVVFWKNVKLEFKYLVEINDEEFEVVLDIDIFYSNFGCFLFFKNNIKVGFIYEYLFGD